MERLTALGLIGSPVRVMNSRSSRDQAPRTLSHRDMLCASSGSSGSPFTRLAPRHVDLEQSQVDVLDAKREGLANSKTRQVRQIQHRVVAGCGRVARLN